MKKWKPKKEEWYWSIDLLYTKYLTDLLFVGDSIDKSNVKIQNCFRTKKEAQEALAKIKKVLKGEL